MQQFEPTSQCWGVAYLQEEAPLYSLSVCVSVWVGVGVCGYL